jgi:type II secretory pathway component GspD/PulD (secretin)
MNAHRLAIRALLSLTLLPVGLASHAQSPDAKQSEADCNKLQTRAEKNDCEIPRFRLKTFYLKNITQQNDANEIMVAIRNVLDPGLKIYYVSSQEALIIDTYPEQMAKAEALLQVLDIPHKTYRLTYTITELDSGKALGTEHISFVVVDGQPTTVKQGDKIPVATGIAAAADSSSTQTQFTYLDIGLNFNATLNALENGAILKTKVEQSSLGQPSTIAGITEPVVRQTVLEGSTLLIPGKPVLVGSIDVPNSTHRYDIAVVMDAIK